MLTGATSQSSYPVPWLLLVNHISTAIKWKYENQYNSYKWANVTSSDISNETQHNETSAFMPSRWEMDRSCSIFPGACWDTCDIGTGQGLPMRSDDIIVHMTVHNSSAQRCFDIFCFLWSCYWTDVVSWSGRSDYMNYVEKTATSQS